MAFDRHVSRGKHAFTSGLLVKSLYRGALALSGLLLACPTGATPNTTDAIRLERAQAAKRFCKDALKTSDGLIARGNIVCFSGNVPEGAAAEKLAKSIRRADIFVVRSGGGDVRYALDIADVLAARPRTIVALDYCVSSCANYWFLGAAYKVVGANDGVGFHGGPPPKNDCEDVSIDCVALSKLFYRSRDFLKNRGMDYRIIYSPPASYDLSQRETTMWVDTKDDLINRWKVPGILQYDLGKDAGK